MKMKATDYLKTHNSFSLEVFPPKTPVGHEKLFSAGGVLEKLYTLNPDYISCTCAVQGRNAEEQLNVLSKIRSDGRIATAHYVAIGAEKEEAKARLQTYLDHGVDHILALRGDKQPEWTDNIPGMHYSTELIELVRKKFGDRFTMAVAGSPEGHVESISYLDDVKILKLKQDLGADYCITQLCWDMEQFARWLDAIRAAGITLPVDAGIMPVTTITGTLTQALSHNACVMDRELSKLITKYWLFPNPYASEDWNEKQKKEDFRKAGLDYTIRLIERYKALGVDGIHLYAMNKYDDVAYIVENSSILKNH